MKRKMFLAVLALALLLGSMAVAEREQPKPPDNGNESAPNPPSRWGNVGIGGPSTGSGNHNHPDQNDLPPVIFLDESGLRDLNVTPASSTKKLELKGNVKDDKGVAYVKVNGERVALAADGSFSFVTFLQEGDNQFLIEAVDSGGNRATREITVRGPSSAAAPAPAAVARSAGKPSLWLLSIGVSKYKNPSFNLAYAENDARMLADFFTQQEGKLFTKVNAKVLVNEQATRGNIMMAMTQHLGKAGPDDVVMVFVAGHGVKSQQTGSYYFVTYNAEPENLIFEGLKWSDFDEGVKILSQNVNKVVLILDTCHSGAMQVAMRSLGTGEDLSQAMTSASGLYTLAASKGGESSLENASFKLNPKDPGHGAFTYSLLKGLAGEANYDNNQYISLSELFNYVAKNVPQMTNGTQHPYFSVQGTDLPIAVK